MNAQALLKITRFHYSFLLRHAWQAAWGCSGPSTTLSSWGKAAFCSSLWQRLPPCSLWPPVLRASCTCHLGKPLHGEHTQLVPFPSDGEATAAAAGPAGCACSSTQSPWRHHRCPPGVSTRHSHCDAAQRTLHFLSLAGRPSQTHGKTPKVVKVQMVFWIHLIFCHKLIFPSACFPVELGGDCIYLCFGRSQQHQRGAEGHSGQSTLQPGARHCLTQGFSERHK